MNASNIVGFVIVAAFAAVIWAGATAPKRKLHVWTEDEEQWLSECAKTRYLSECHMDLWSIIR